jgi:hypothetical protein
VLHLRPKPLSFLKKMSAELVCREIWDKMEVGEVTEWLMVPLSKSGLRLYRSVGSNPTLSANNK